MIKLKDGRVALVIEIHVEKRVVDSLSGNPTATGAIEIFDDLPTLINSNTGTRRGINFSQMGDLTMYPATFNDVEKWLSAHDDYFKGSSHEPT